MKAHRLQAGFSLLELATVIVIIALVSAMGIGASLGALESAKRAQTERKMDVIENALMNFRIANDRLPCPADPTLPTTNAGYGVASAFSYFSIPTHGIDCMVSNFTDAFGTYASAGDLPARTMGLPDEYMYDGWGRKFSYIIAIYAALGDANFVGGGVFKHQYPTGASGGFTVLDGSHNPRTTAAIYALISFGPNGHGAFLSNGTNVNAGSTNADELANCNCNSSGVNSFNFITRTIVQKDATQDASHLLTNSFDDIVRYKERWQLQTDEDGYNYPGGMGDMLAVGYPAAGSADSVYLFYRNSLLWHQTAFLNPQPKDNVTGVDFTGDNSGLFVYSNNGCYLYPITVTNAVPASGTGVATPAACPAYNGHNTVALSKSGVLAISQTATPYVKFFSLSGGAFSPITGFSGAGDIPASEPTSVSLTNDSTLLVLSNSAYTTVYYHKQDGTYTALTPQPSGMPANAASAIFSPNGQYLAVTSGSNPTGPYIWGISPPQVFTAISGVNYNSPAPVWVSFSPDGKFVDSIIYTPNNCGHRWYSSNFTHLWSNYIAGNSSSFAGCTSEKISAFSTDATYSTLAGVASGPLEGFQGSQGPAWIDNAYAGPSATDPLSPGAIAYSY